MEGQLDETTLCNFKKEFNTRKAREGFSASHYVMEFGHKETQLKEQTVLLVFETQCSPGWP